MKESRAGLGERWMKLVYKKGSVLCAGIDPSHLPFDETSCEEKRTWALAYIEAVAPYCAAIKPNIQFWKAGRDMQTLKELYQCAASLDLLVIEDSKLADIGSTNEAGLSFASAHADAVTVAPFAGNLQSTVRYAKSLGLGVITLCLMSNPEYQLMKRKLVPVGTGYLEQYLFRAYEARNYGADGIVVGAPSPDNGIIREELEAIAGQLNGNMVILCPGFGAQGGNLTEPFQVFGADRIIVNAGRAVMYPNGPSSTAADQAEAAKELNRRLNTERTAVHA